MSKHTTSIGDAIREARKNASLTQQAMSKKTGLSQSYLCQLENNVRTPSMAALIRIAKACKVKSAELLKHAA